MINFGASTTVMLKQIPEVLKLEYEPLDRGAMQLDGNIVQAISIFRKFH